MTLNSILSHLAVTDKHNLFNAKVNLGPNAGYSGSTEPFKISSPTTYAGAFAVANHMCDWHTCRETFASSFNRKVEEIIFSHKPRQTQNIAAFFAKVENILGLRKNRTIVLATQRSNISKIIVPDWWRKYLVRRSLFTVLLRSAQNYQAEKDNFEAALFSDKYAAETRNAIVAFLNGNTLCKKNVMPGGGWRNTFLNKSNKEVLNILHQPPKKAVLEVNDEANQEDAGEEEDEPQKIADL